MNRLAMFLFVLLAFIASACAVNVQKKAINYARIGTASAGVALNATDTAVAEYYKTKPASDDKSYCENKIASLMLKQVRIFLVTTADTILAWEESLAAYLAKKDAGTETEFDWDEVLSSEAAWLKIATSVLAALDGVRKSLKLWSVEIPHALDYAWGFLSGFAGKTDVDFEFDFKDLEGSICIDYLPGGGS